MSSEVTHLRADGMRGESALSVRGPFAVARDCYPLLWRSLREVTLIALAAIVPAVVLYGFRQPQSRAEGIVQPVSQDALWIDARSEAEFAREHIPGALNLNEHNWETALVHLFKTWQPPRTIIVYCSAGCSDSSKIAAKLAELGIEPVEVLEGGYEAWKHSNG